MPTRASSRYSRDTNRGRTGFIGRTVTENEERIIAQIQQKTFDIFQIKINGYLQPLEIGGVVLI